MPPANCVGADIAPLEVLLNSSLVLSQRVALALVPLVVKRPAPSSFAASCSPSYLV